MDPKPAVARDRQLERLHLLNAVVFAQPYHTTDWMLRWAFLSLGRNRQYPRFTATVVWIRQALDVLAARAAERVRTAARQYRDSFLRKLDPRTCPVPNGTFDLWAHGYGEVDDPVTEARVAEQARAFPRKSIDHVRVALDGDAESLYEALREAGVAALRWPWVLRVLDGWRDAIERLGGQDLKTARARMKGVSAALVHITGRGAVARPDRLALRTEAVRVAEAYFLAWLKDPAAPIPARLLEIGEWIHEDWKRTRRRKGRGTYKRLDEAAIVEERQRVTRTAHALPRARAIVSKTFGVLPSTLARSAWRPGKRKT